MKRKSSMVALRRSVGFLAAIPALYGALPAHAAHAATVHITTFYAAGAQSYAGWRAAGYAPPPVQTTFASGTSKIAFYVEYVGAGPYRFSLDLHSGQAATVKVTRTWQGNAASPVEMVELAAAAGAFPKGAYQADLLLGAQVLGSAKFSVSAAGTTTNGNSPDGAAHGVKVSEFRASTVAAVDRWVAQPGFYPLPVTSTRFAAGTTQIGFIFLFKGAVPHVSVEQVAVHGPEDVSGPSRVLARASDGIYEYLTAQAPLAYPNGRYTAVVLIDGQATARAVFTVG